MRRVLEFFHLIEREGTRAHQTHVAQQHIGQLRKLVDAGAAQPPAKRRDARIGIHFEDGAVHLVKGLQLGPAHLGIIRHRPEFVHDEWFPVLPGAALFENDGPGRGEADADGHHGHGQDEEKEGPECADPVDHTLDEKGPGDIRGGAEDEHGPPREGVKVRLGDGGSDKIGCQPGGHALYLTGADGFLHAVELAVAGRENNASHGVPVHGLDQVGERLFLNVDTPGHVHEQLLLGSEGLLEGGNILGRAGQQNRLAQLSAQGPPPHVLDDDALLRQQHGQGDASEKDRDGTISEGQAQENDAGAHDHSEVNHGPEDLGDRFPLRLVDRRTVESLQVEQDGPEQHDHDEQPGVVAEAVDRLR